MTPATGRLYRCLDRSVRGPSRKDDPCRHLGTRHDQITGTARADEIKGFAGDDLIMARGGWDYISGNRGDDELRGGRGHDVSKDGAGHDLVYGGIGREAVTLGDGPDRVWLGAGDDLEHLVRDGRGDIIRCGRGYDYALYHHGRDPGDRFFGCEVVEPRFAPDVVRRPGAVVTRQAAVLGTHPDVAHAIGHAPQDRRCLIR